MSSAENSVPLLDLKQQYRSIKPEIDAAVQRVVESQNFILGAEVDVFEAAAAEYCSSRCAVGVSSGTDALLLALMALRVGPGDEVITTPYTFFATAGSIARVGAKSVFVDIDPVTYNIDPAKIESAISPRTKAIMPVHLFGLCAEIDRINDVASRKNIPVIEDAAQAIGSEYRMKRAGSLGAVGCFSFFPSKNLGAFGDAGMVTTSDMELAERLRKLRVHGGMKRYFHDEVGGNFRIDALQAAVLAVKLKHLESWSEGRKRNAAVYRELFREAGLSGETSLSASSRPTPEHPISLPGEPAGFRHIYNQFVVRASRREELRVHLERNGVGSAVYYPLPLHLQECFSSLGYKAGSFPESELAAEETLALPIFPELSRKQLETVVKCCRDFYRK